jgi:tetratricopeptide (TPR) repeat protein
LTEPEQDRLGRRYTENIEAFDFFLHAKEHQLRRTQEGLRRARELLEHAIELDPQFAGAYAILADNYRQEWMFGWRRDEGVLDEALELATKAMRLDDKLPLVHSLLGWIHLWRKNHGDAENEAQLAVRLDPNFAEGYARLGHIVAFAGRPEEGINLIRKALRLDPHSPFLYFFFLGHAHASARQDREAVDAFRRALIRNPDHIGSRHYLAVSLWYLGYVAEAKAQLAALTKLDPNFSVNALARRIPHSNPEILERHVAALRALEAPD